MYGGFDPRRATHVLGGGGGTTPPFDLVVEQTRCFAPEEL